MLLTEKLPYVRHRRIASTLDDVLNASQSTQSDVRLVEHCTVGIKSSSGYRGSGILLSYNGLVLTAKHVAEHASRDSVVFFGGKHFSGIKPLCESIHEDLTLVKANLPGPAKATKLAFADGEPPVVMSLSRAEGELRKGYGMYIKSLPAMPERSAGRLMYSSHVSPGFSGGPMVSDDGRIVGVNVSGGLTGSYSIPSTHVRALLEFYRDAVSAKRW